MAKLLNKKLAKKRKERRLKMIDRKRLEAAIIRYLNIVRNAKQN